MAKTKIEKPTRKLKKDGTPDGRAENGGAREGAGRPAFEPSDAERRQVEALSGYGLPFDQIAVLIRGGISLDTLREHFSAELVAGKAKANSGVGKTLYQKAMSGDTTAMIWWTKSQMRWAERHELSGPDGGPIKTESKVTLDPAEAYMKMLGGG